MAHGDLSTGELWVDERGRQEASWAIRSAWPLLTDEDVMMIVLTAENLNDRRTEELDDGEDQEQEE